MNWIKPSVVSTPNIEDDIRNLLSEDILSMYQECPDADKRKRIVRITEMLDYANHLSAFSSFLCIGTGDRYMFRNNRSWVKCW